MDYMDNLPIASFTGQYAFLANPFPCDIRFRGYVFESVEQAYHLGKVDPRNKFMDGFAEVIKAAPDLRSLKQIGHQLPLRGGWKEGVDLEVMHSLIWQKFGAPWNRHFYGKMLLRTDSRPLVEGNWWGDTHWGVCNGIGENWLGITLELTRSDLVRGVPYESVTRID